MISSTGSTPTGSDMVKALGQMQRQMQDLSAGAAAGTGTMLSDPSLNIAGNAATEAAGAEELLAGAASDSVGEFARMLAQAFETVNNIQNESASMQTRFDLGDRSITLADVMIASQKSSISFEATLQVRNRMVDAYKQISQMQI